ncbi:hypothetical protein GQ457_05G028030 [Hibiscus cannabinus]
MGKNVQPESNMRDHRKISSTLKTKYLSFISSIRKSIQKSHHRLVRFFSKVEGAKRQGKGFVIILREESGRGGLETAKSPRLQLEFEADSDFTSVIVSRKSNRN